MLTVFRHITLWLCLLLSVSALADQLTPSERAPNGLSIRAEANGDSPKLGTLPVGEHAKILGAVPRYYKIRTQTGITGYVAKSYSTVLPVNDSLTLVTWNLEGPGGLDNKALAEFGEFVQGADAIVIEETLGLNQTKNAAERANLGNWSLAVTDFAKDSYTNPYKKQELAILTPHPLSGSIEVDPYASDDSPAMREVDQDFQVPDWVPSQQRSRKGARGWLWVDLPTYQLTVIAVHLKSSQGANGYADKSNSDKREAVAAGVVEAIIDDVEKRPTWSYVVMGDFNVAPGDAAKVGVDFNASCTTNTCVGYDQTHAIFGAGLREGFMMRNLVEGLSASYAAGDFVDSPIDNIYAWGPIFDSVTRLSVERGPHFGSDHYAVKVALTY
ncbi:SH3 domain-containing protein [Agaribacterium sp. ZY112]|uniref:SH3 domain-containing protein n=1 Tax=Agaribacterium sp. ZY112 TaxID=3233574 RepID=UPI0035232045